jgi:hypothetical protein
VLVAEGPCVSFALQLTTHATNRDRFSVGQIGKLDVLVDGLDVQGEEVERRESINGRREGSEVDVGEVVLA